MTKVFFAAIWRALPFATAKALVALFLGMLFWVVATLWSVDFNILHCLESLHAGRGWTLVLVPICLLYIIY